MPPTPTGSTGYIRYIGYRGSMSNFHKKLFSRTSIVCQINRTKALIFNRLSLSQCRFSILGTVFLDFHLQSMSQTYPQHVPNMSQTCPKHVQNMSRTCPTHFQNISKICPKHVQSISKTFPRHFQNMLIYVNKSCVLGAVLPPGAF